MKPWAKALLGDIGNAKRRAQRHTQMTVEERLDRISALAETGHLFETDAEVCDDIARLAACEPWTKDILRAAKYVNTSPKECLAEIRLIIADTRRAIVGYR